jgi:hypothetical protein
VELHVLEDVVLRDEQVPERGRREVELRWYARGPTAISGSDFRQRAQPEATARSAQLLVRARPLRVAVR